MLNLGDINEEKHSVMRGFTLAEIMITMVILGFVAALSVPMIGQKKVAKPVVDNTEHGTIECFYEKDANGSWVLKEFLSDSRGNKRITDLSGQTSCRFDPPENVKYFTVIAIGAGGDGSMLNQVPTIVMDDIRNNIDTATAGYIHLMPENPLTHSAQSFQSQLQKAPSWVAKYWDKQWEDNPILREPDNGAPRGIKYTITSHIGKGGDAVCQGIVKNGISKDGEQCSAVCNVSMAECEKKGCLHLKTAAGGNSGHQTYVELAPIKLKSNHNPKVYTDSAYSNIFSITPEDYISIPISTSGTDAKYDATNTKATPGTNGENITTIKSDGIFKKYTPYEKGNEFSKGGQRCSSINDSIKGANRQLSGTFSTVPESIFYYYDVTREKPNFGLAGAPGAVATKIYQKFLGSEITLTPAINGSNSMMTYKDKNNNVKTLITAGPGNNADGNYTTDIVIAEEDDLKLGLPTSIYPAKFVPNNPNFILENTTYRSYIKMLATNNPTATPGRGGSGAFRPLILQGTHSPYTVINNVIVHEETIDFTKIQTPSAVDFCQGAEVVNDTNGYFCKSSKGNPGAVIIRW